MSRSRPTPGDVLLGVGAALLVEAVVLAVCVTWYATHYDDGFQFPFDDHAKLLLLNLRALAWHTGCLMAGVPVWLLLRRLGYTRWWAAMLAGFAGSYALIVAFASSSGGTLYPLDFVWIAGLASLGALCWVVGRAVAYRQA